MRDMESATCCTLFLPDVSDILNEMQDVGKAHQELVGNLSRQVKKKPTRLVLLETIEKTVTNKAGERRIERPRSRGGRGNKDDQFKHREHDVHRDEHVDKKHAGTSQPTHSLGKQRHVGKPMMRDERKSTHLVLQHDAEGHRNDPKDQDRRFTTCRPGEKAEALRTLRLFTEEEKFHELSTWIKACRHPFAKVGQTPRSRSGRIHLLQMDKTARGGSEVG